MAKGTRKQYPNEFRIKVAKEAEEGSPTEVAKRYKLPENSVYNWRAVLRKKGEAGFVGMGKRGPRSPMAAKNGAGKGASPAVLKQKVDNFLADLRGQIVTEQKLRLAAEKELHTLRSKLQQLVRS